ncbi:MAG: lipid A biosynthesis lauroyl acyltransferase, partial [Dokdonella sp.]
MPSALPPFRISLLSPRHWPAWVGLALLWLAARLPYAILMHLGAGLGWLAARLLRSRRRIAQRNLEVCFPHLADGERAHMLELTLRDSGLMLVEFALGWFGSSRAIARVPVRIEGIEHLHAALAAGRGVLLTGAHFSH